MVLCRCRILYRTNHKIYEPKIHDYDKTYFRIVHRNLHTIRGSVATGERLTELEHKGIDTEFKGWKTGDTKHILVYPHHKW